jgi:NADH dehydrogenase FAD-containing subunit
MLKAVTTNGVELTDGTDITARTLVWTAGTSPHPLLEKLRVPNRRAFRIVRSQRTKFIGQIGLNNTGDSLWRLEKDRTSNAVRIGSDPRSPR